MLPFSPSDITQMEEKHVDAKKAPADKKKPVARPDNTVRDLPKPESSSEYEGAPSRKPTGDPPVETKTETSSSSGE